VESSGHDTVDILLARFMKAASMVALSESQSDPVVGPWCRQLVENDALALCLQLFTAIDEEQSRLVAALKDSERRTARTAHRVTTLPPVPPAIAR
jgi:hypothetical protein